MKGISINNLVMFLIVASAASVGVVGAGYLMAKTRGLSTVIATAHSGFDS